MSVMQGVFVDASGEPFDVVVRENSGGNLPGTEGEYRQAIFSPEADRALYRYALLIVWDDSKPLLNFLMMNPSTADEWQDDRTVAACKRRAKLLGFGGIIVTNVFAYRSTDQKALALVDDPVGPHNDKIIDAVAELCEGGTVCAWGQPPRKVIGRGAIVKAKMQAAGRKLFYLKLSKCGRYPWHPLYVRGDEPLKEWAA